MDTIHSVLNWAGFIPVVGDALDAINALIYFIRKMWMDGMFSLVAIIPVVGTGIGQALRKVYNFAGKPIVNIIKKLSTNGKGAAEAFFKLFTSGSSKLQSLIEPLLKVIKSGADKIASMLGKINISSLNNKILDVSMGWIGLPNWIVKMLDGFVKQLKSFFSHMANPPSSVLHISQKKLERAVHHKLLPHEEKEARDLYKTNKVDKKKYPSVEAFLKAQLELKNKKALELNTKDVAAGLKDVGNELNTTAIKAVARWMKQKEGNEIKLWSEYPAIVKLVQKAVGVKPDGSFGPSTEKAVKIVQKKKGLRPDGVVGPNTWAKIT